MILKKIIKDGQEIYVKLTPEEAKEASKNDDEFIHVDEDDDDEDIDEALDEEKEEEKEKEKEREGRHGRGSMFEFTQRIKNDINRSIRPHMRHLGKTFSFTDEDDDPETSKLMRILPFMDEDDVHEIMQKYLDSDPKFAKLKLPAIMPFLSEADCDEVFKKALTTKELERYISAIVPFVSEKALSGLVDQYLEGKYPNLNVDRLYPFLNPKDIKRIFHHLMDKE
ncbi:MAG TPA: hypothetical protein DCX17_00785 [Firmicutes bacterium]|jgi:hypothetical protein|nr:hypothetical protein [Bacillota bacterium]